MSEKVKRGRDTTTRQYWPEKVKFSDLFCSPDPELEEYSIEWSSSEEDQQHSPQQAALSGLIVTTAKSSRNTRKKSTSVSKTCTAGTRENAVIPHKVTNVSVASQEICKTNSVKWSKVRKKWAGKVVRDEIIGRPVVGLPENCDHKDNQTSPVMVTKVRPYISPISRGSNVGEGEERGVPLTLPVLGPQHCHRETEKEIIVTAADCTDGDCSGPPSPVLRSVRHAGKQRSLAQCKFTHKQDSNEEISKSVIKNENDEEALCSPVVPVRSIKRKGLSHALDQIRPREVLHIDAQESEEEIQMFPDSNNPSISEPQNDKNESDVVISASTSTLPRHTPEHSPTFPVLRPWHNAALSLLKDSDGDDIVQEVCSQGCNVDNSNVDSQEDFNIDLVFTPSKESQSEDVRSESSRGDPSEEPQVPATSQPAQRLSDWTKLMHMRTPEKPSTHRSEVAVESSKKRPKRDGHGERLRRLIGSWQSSVNMWVHQMSLPRPTKRSLSQGGGAQGPAPHLPPGPSPKGTPEQASVGDRKTIRKKLFSPGVRNLADLLSDSPHSSSSASSSSCFDIPLPKKYVEFEIVRVGGRLPHNAALCVVTDSNVEEFQCDGKIKQEMVGETVENILNPRKKYMVFFALTEHKIKSLHVNLAARVYAPWTNFITPGYKTPVIFTSYFMLRPTGKNIAESKGTSDGSREEKGSIVGTFGETSRTVLMTWTCSCSTDGNVEPWMCEGRHYKTPNAPTSPASVKQLPGLTVTEDTPEELSKHKPRYHSKTILKAIERCGGDPDVPVTITVRVHRCIPIRREGGQVEEWQLVGQDAGGLFCVVRLPNRPLALPLSGLLQEGQGSTHTFSQVTIAKRLTSTQNTGLFSLIWSLHSAYQCEVGADPLLLSLLRDVTTRPPQTHCYMFLVNLGVTQVVPSQQQVVIPLSLPDWSLQEAQQGSHEGQRGNLRLHILYKYDSFLYVVDLARAAASAGEGGSVVDPGAVGAAERVVVACPAALPPWILSNRTSMQSAIFSDVLVYQGSVLVDEYSSVEQVDHKLRLSKCVVHQLLSPLTPHTQPYHLVLVSGIIAKVEAESAHSFPMCSLCQSHITQDQVKEEEVWCHSCGQRSGNHSRGYHLEVWLKCAAELEKTVVKVKLCQRTVEKLLSSCSGSQEEGYEAWSLQGKQLGPLVCVVSHCRRRKEGTTTFTLEEFPY